MRVRQTAGEQGPPDDDRLKRQARRVIGPPCARAVGRNRVERVLDVRRIDAHGIERQANGGRAAQPWNRPQGRGPQDLGDAGRGDDQLGLRDPVGRDAEERPGPSQMRDPGPDIGRGQHDPEDPPGCFEPDHGAAPLKGGAATARSMVILSPFGVRQPTASRHRHGAGCRQPAIRANSGHGDVGPPRPGQRRRRGLPLSRRQAPPADRRGSLGGRGVAGGSRAGHSRRTPRPQQCQTGRACGLRNC